MYLYLGALCESLVFIDENLIILNLLHTMNMKKKVYRLCTIV